MSGFWYLSCRPSSQKDFERRISQKNTCTLLRKLCVSSSNTNFPLFARFEQNRSARSDRTWFTAILISRQVPVQWVNEIEIPWIVVDKVNGFVTFGVVTCVLSRDWKGKRCISINKVEEATDGMGKSTRKWSRSETRGCKDQSKPLSVLWISQDDLDQTFWFSLSWSKNC